MSTAAEVPRVPSGLTLADLRDLLCSNPLPMAAKLGRAGPLARIRIGPLTRYVVNDGTLIHAILTDQEFAEVAAERRRAHMWQGRDPQDDR